MSPASTRGKRATLLLSPRARSELAARLRAEPVPMGEVFSFLSGLYFRGKLAYARAFASPPDRAGTIAGDGVLVITTDSGLQPADTPLTLDALRMFSQVDIAPDNPGYRLPLEETARSLAAAIGEACDVVLLGSIATPKYVDVLTEVFAERLVFPEAFVGRGDMSRGGLLLRQVAEARELAYVPVLGTAKTGRRPPKLPPVRRVR